MKKLIIAPPRHVSLTRLTMKRHALTDLEHKQRFYYDLCLDAAGPDNQDVRNARDQWYWTRAQIHLLDDLIGEQA